MKNNYLFQKLICKKKFYIKKFVLQLTLITNVLLYTIIIFMGINFLFYYSFALDNNFHINKIVEFIPLGTGSKTGTYYPLGMAFANIISKSIPELNIMSISTKGSIQNLDLLSSGDIKLCICQSDIAYDAITGKGLFEKNAQKDLKILMSLFPEVVQIATHKNSKIKNISDLKGKKIILGSLESGNSKTAQTLLSAFNISLNDIEPIFINYDEAIKTMITRRADAFILIAGLPTRVISELFSNNCINLLEFNSNEIDFLINKMNFFSKAIISTKTYTQLNQEISTVAINALLVSNINMSDITAHKIVKNILDNLQYIKTCHPRAADISIKSIYDSVPQGSMHTGTIEYLKSLKNTEKSY